MLDSVSDKIMKFGKAASLLSALFRTGLGALKPATIMILRGDANRLPKHRASAVSSTACGLTTDIVRKDSSPVSAHLPSGSDSWMFICTGAVRPVNATVNASLICLFAYHFKSGKSISVRLYDPLTKFDSASYCLIVCESSWSIHSIGRSADMTTNGTFL